MKKRFISLVIILVIALSSIPVYAQGISVYVNNKKLEFDVSPQLISDRTFVPMRKIFESLGATVSWDDTTQTATGRKDNTVVNITINSFTLFKNGTPKQLDAAPQLIDSRTMVPVRAIAESFDCKVEWDDNTQSVLITTDGNTETSQPILSAAQISERVAPSVFYIEVYDYNGEALGSGSGFFISSAGVAVTNYHVIENTSSAIITTIDGKSFNVNNIISYDEELDIAIIRVSKTTVDGNTVSGFSSLVRGNSDNIVSGQTVYALGCPVGLKNTISNGIISNPRQTIGSDTYIQITAPISHGSSGGALLNEYGEAIGVTSAGIDDAQNIGFAIPINVINMFDLNAEGVSYEEFSEDNSKFVVEVSPSTIELIVGESTDVYVHATGKGDWSVYYEVDDENMVACTWGDWLEDYDGICPLTIKALSPGTTTVTVYSDFDSVGKDITVNIKRPSVALYPGTTVPTYTAITGAELYDYHVYDNNKCYCYYNINTDSVLKYIDYLLNNGFEYYSEKKDETTSSYMYLTPDDKLMMVTLAFKWNEVWIYVPR